MANKMIANIQSLTTGVDKLTTKINDLYKALEKVNTVSTSSLKNAASIVDTVGGNYGLTKGAARPGTGADGAKFPAMAQQQILQGQNLLSNSLGAFTSPFQAAVATGGVQNTLSGAGQILSGGMNMIPSLSTTMTSTYNYYQAALKVPGINRNQLERATFSALNGGVSSVGGPAQAAAILAGMGYTPGSANYRQAMGQVGGAYKYLGMSNEAAAAAVGGFQTGPMGANLFQYGISTMGANGKEKTPGQIARELMNYMTGGAKVTAEDVRASYQKGALGANLRTMGFSADQQSIIYQSMIDIASGRNPDLATAGPAKGNANTFLTSQGRINAATTETMMNAENAMIKGFENAADTVEMFNRALRHATDLLGYGAGFGQGVGGSQVGQGLTQVYNGIQSGVQGVMQILGSIAMFGAGSTSGYGASFGVANRKRSGGGSPVAGAAVSAGYGATNNRTDSPWANTNGKHTGVDFAVPEGTPVSSVSDGVVSQVDLNQDYGTSILIDNSDGTQSVYAHLKERSVKPGDKVKQGQRIAKSGQSGNAGAPHLHYELRDAKNHPVNPESSLGGIFGSYTTTQPTGIEFFNQSTSSTTDSTSTGSSTSTSGSINISSPTKSETEWASSLLTGLNVPITENNIKAISTWMRFESGAKTPLGSWNNPLNTTYELPNSVSMNSHGVKAYQTTDEGLQATIATLTGKNSGPRGYDNIISLLKPGNVSLDTFAAGVNQSSWGTHIHGGGTTGYGAAVPSPTVASTSNKTVNVTLNIARASEQEAIQFAKKVKYYLEHDTETTMIGKK